jgi:NHL repeat-containing protein
MKTTKIIPAGVTAAFVFFCMIASTQGTPLVYNWTTIGGVANTFGGSDGTNSAALFYQPYGVAPDGSGNLYVADYSGDTIRKMTRVGTNWVVTTIAGQFLNAGSADGTNTAALFNQPRGLVVGSNGNIFICDGANYTIRMLTAVGTNWVSSTIAGSVGNVGNVDGIGTASQFDSVDGIIQDKAGNLFVASYGGDTIREITPSGTNWVVSTIAGLAGTAGSTDGIGSNARFRMPYDIAIDSNGNLFVTDHGNNTLRELKLVGSNWSVSTIAGSSGNTGSADGSDNNARFKGLTGAAVDGSGNVYVTDTSNDTIRKIDPVGTNGVVTIGGQVGNTVPADGTNSVATFDLPRGLKVDGRGNVYVADFDHGTVRLGTPLIPNISSTSLSGKNLTFSGINGPAGGTYVVLASTNAALPLNQWTPVATNILTATGNFSFTATNAVNPNASQQFYTLQLQ